MDANRPDYGVILDYEGGNYCNETSLYSLRIEILCDEDAVVPTYDINTASIANPCSPSILMTARAGCPIFSMHTLWDFTQRYSLAFAFIMLGIGGFLLGAGGKFYKATMFLAG